MFEATSSEDSETARLGFPYFHSKKRTVPKYHEIPYMKTSYFAYKIANFRLPSRVSSFRARTRLKTDMSGASFRVLFWPRGIARVRIPIILQKNSKILCNPSNFVTISHGKVQNLPNLPHGGRSEGAKNTMNSRVPGTLPKNTIIPHALLLCFV